MLREPGQVTVDWKTEVKCKERVGICVDWEGG